jgi:hypothetical protein
MNVVYGNGPQERAGSPNLDVLLKRIPENIVLVGDHPLATRIIEGVKVPKNSAACIFLPQEKRHQN